MAGGLKKGETRERKTVPVKKDPDQVDGRTLRPEGYWKGREPEIEVDEYTPLEELPGWETFSAGQRRFLYYLPFARSRAEAARKANILPATIYHDIGAHPLFKAAAVMRGRKAKAPRGEALLIDLLDKAQQVVWDRLNATTTNPAMEKVRLETARWAIQHLAKYRAAFEDPEVEKILKGEQTKEDDEGLGLGWKDLVAVDQTLPKPEENGVTEDPVA